MQFSVFVSSLLVGIKPDGVTHGLSMTMELFRMSCLIAVAGPAAKSDPALLFIFSRQHFLDLFQMSLQISNLSKFSVWQISIAPNSKCFLAVCSYQTTSSSTLFLSSFPLNKLLINYHQLPVLKGKYAKTYFSNLVYSFILSIKIQ